MDEPRRKTPMVLKPTPPNPYAIGAALGASLVLFYIGWSMLQAPTKLMIDSTPPAATPAATPTRAAPTAAPAVLATPLPLPTEVPTMDLPPLREVELAPPAPEPPPPPVVEEAAPVEVPATPLVFAQGVCAAWRPPLKYPEECNHE